MANSNKRKITALFVLVALIVTALIGVIITLDRTITTETLASIDYKIGALDEDGKFDDSKASIVTKDFNTVDGLTVEFNEDAEVTVRIFFYDEEEEFLSATEELSSDYTFVETESVEYFKIVITPTDDEEITLFEKGGYVKQLKVTFDKK